ncbi:peptidase T [Vibrio fluvialis]|uniref:peptidase T n=1 Tax=Vibrio fluvialis TaxID=676 RepID=UPI001EEA643A|nr:peptidase T [Vibrio fluvialis]MCG6381984.1 peptidase T [Vibrio fluvialis]
MTIYEIISTAILVISLCINVYQFRARKPKFKIRISRSLEIDKNGVDTYLCARIFISNYGSETAYYSGIKAIDDQGELFFPSCSLGTKSEIPSNASIIGTIPSGHLLCHGTKKLIVIDGTLHEHRVPKRSLAEVILELKRESVRLEKLNIQAHPKNSCHYRKEM